MIRVSGQLIFMCTPRAGSRTVSKTLRARCHGVNLINKHHADKSDCERLREYEEPVVALIRNPYTYMMSRWAYVKRADKAWQERSWEHYFKWFKPDLDQYHWQDRIAMYDKHVDHYYLFEDGLDAFFDNVGFPGVEIVTVGALDIDEWRIPEDQIEQKWKDDINERFPLDVALYRKIASEPPTRLPRYQEI